MLKVLCVSYRNIMMLILYGCRFFRCMVSVLDAKLFITNQKLKLTEMIYRIWIYMRIKVSVLEHQCHYYVE
jgi:hypothetical protein